MKILAPLILMLLLVVGAKAQGFEYGHWVFPLDRAGQQNFLNTVGQQGWLECFPYNNHIYCSRPLPWSTQVEWKSWEIPKRGSSIEAFLTEAGLGNYDQCFVWSSKRLWCSRPITVGQ